MKPWIDPRERRARWWWSAQFVIGALALIAAVSLLLWGDLTGEERMITAVATVLVLVCAVGALWKFRQTPRDFQQHEEQDESHSDPK